MGQYLPIVVLAILAILFGVGSLIASKLLAPRRPNTAKGAPYECGIVPSLEAPERFPVSFYVVAMLFIMFDIEIIFAYPYAVASNSLGVYGFWELVAFSAVFFVAFVYVVARGALDWGPVKKPRRLVSRDGDILSESRSVSTTIRRVGFEGRETREKVSV
ncbi:MAG: NADH-quinone oxidoreductase subunit A [Actinobacteria bacterium]|nr:NADH-quinone oxidoreductase subunit A [Actinomycetota bacterium]